MGTENAAVKFELNRQNMYSVYVLVIFLLTYLLNQLDRYMLAIVTKPLAQVIALVEYIHIRLYDYQTYSFRKFTMAILAAWQICLPIIQHLRQSVKSWPTNHCIQYVYYFLADFTDMIIFISNFFKMCGACIQ